MGLNFTKRIQGAGITQNIFRLLEYHKIYSGRCNIARYFQGVIVEYINGAALSYNIFRVLQLNLKSQYFQVVRIIQSQYNNQDTEGMYFLNVTRINKAFFIELIRVHFGGRASWRSLTLQSMKVEK